MFINYVVEMFIDRVCVLKNYLKEKYNDKSFLEYYEKRKYYYVLYNEVRFFLEDLF